MDLIIRENFYKMIHSYLKKKANYFFIYKLELSTKYFSSISLTTPGSANVVISPRSSGWLAAIFLSILLIIFPDLVLGKFEVI